jgi:hypothetical protein
MRIARGLALVWLAGASAVMVGPGCGGGASIESLCERSCECTGCSDDEFADCIDDAEDLEKYAEERGCSDQFSELLDCTDTELECNDGETDVDGCEAELVALGNCAEPGDDTPTPDSPDDGSGAPSDGPGN